MDRKDVGLVCVDHQQHQQQQNKKKILRCVPSKTGRLYESLKPISALNNGIKPEACKNPAVNRTGVT
jgi:hypothetical protein